MKKGFRTVLMAVAIVLLCNGSLFGQAAQPSSQSAPGAEAQPNSINDKDVEMLRANLRANRKELMARNMTLTADEATKFWPVFDQYRKRGHQTQRRTLGVNQRIRRELQQHDGCAGAGLHEES